MGEMVQSEEHQNRIAVVTGGSSGIGRRIAQTLNAHGAKVFIFDVNREHPSHQVSQLSETDSIAFFQVDVRKQSAVDEAFNTAANRAGRIDYLICCAAVFRPRSFLDLDPEHWQETLDINLTGTFLCCRSALRFMRSQQFGRIVLFSSMLARTGANKGSHYAASKGGVLGLARTLALEVAHENIRVNTISPGLTDTPQPRAFLSDADFELRKKQIPLGRIGHIEDMVSASLFLLSDESSYMTGQDIRVNGGAVLW